MIDWWLLPAYFLLDLLYIAWMWATEKHKPLLGAFASLSIYGMSILGTLEAVENRLNMIPIFLGVFGGSYVGIWWKKRRAQNKY
jgi:CHASE2 domain-containing sensor protein